MVVESGPAWPPFTVLPFSPAVAAVGFAAAVMLATPSPAFAAQAPVLLAQTDDFDDFDEPAEPGNRAEPAAEPAAVGAGEAADEGGEAPADEAANGEGAGESPAGEEEEPGSGGSMDDGLGAREQLIECPDGSKPFTADQCGAEAPEIFPANPFLGDIGKGGEIALFAVVFLMLYILAVAMFRASVTNGGSVLGSFLGSMALVLVVSLLAAVVCFAEHTFQPGWCTRACDDGGDSAIAAIQGLGQLPSLLNWVWWGIAAGAVALLLAVLKFATAGGPPR